MSHLANKVALVTGGSRGIGAGIVRRLAKDGASVAFTYVSDKNKAEELAREVEANGGKAFAIEADNINPLSVQAAVESTVAKYGKLDILVNNAGVGIVKPIDDFTFEDFDTTIAVNVKAVFAAIKAAAKHMVAGSRIINIGSINATRMPFEGGGVYSMSKAAIQGLTTGLSRDFGPLGITINNIQPGPVNTDMNPEDGPFADYVKPFISVGRYAQPQEIAGFVSYLAGPESGYINGASLNIDGGFKG